MPFSTLLHLPPLRFHCVRGCLDRAHCCNICTGLDAVSVTHSLKGQCHKIFCFLFFSWINFPQPQSIPLGPFRIFSKIRGDIRSSRLTTNGKWQMKKIFNLKNVNNFVGTPLDSRVNIYINFCLQFQLKLRYLQPDINPIICRRCRWHQWQICRWCRWYRWQFATGVGDTGDNLPPVSLTPAAI